MNVNDINPVEPANVPQTLDTIKLPNDFQMNANGTSAKKGIEIEIDGKKQLFYFTIYFPKNSSEKSKVDFIKQFTTEKVENLTQQACDLGVGKKFESMHFDYNEKSGIKKLDLKRFDGTLKTLDMTYFNKKEIDIKRLNDPIKTQKFDKKLKMFKTMEKIMSKNFEPFFDEDFKPKSVGEAKKRINELEKKMKDLEENSELKDWYVGNKRALDMVKNYMDSHKNVTQQQMAKWTEENIFNHPDLHKKS